MIPTYGSENPCSTLLGTAQIPFRVDPLSAWLGRRRRVGGQKKSCFDLAENRAADSLWVGDHRYTRILSWVTIWAVFQKTEISKGIGFEAKLTFADFFRPRR